MANDIVKAISGSGKCERGDGATFGRNTDYLLSELADSFFSGSVLVDIFWVAYIEAEYNSVQGAIVLKGCEGAVGIYLDHS